MIGLTGSIACGKSTVSTWLRQQPKCVVIDGDKLSRDLTASGGAALPLIRAEFGESFFLSDGSLNRRKLGNHVFSNEDARLRLDNLMAPMLEDLTEKRIQEARYEGADLCFLDYPLLFEKGYQRFCDSVWCVYLPHDLQLQRLMLRDNLSKEEAEKRISAVLSSDEKAMRSDVVIDNSGSVQFMLSTLPPLLEEEQRLAAIPRRRRSNRYLDENHSSVDAVASPDQRAFTAEKESLPVLDRPARAQKKPSERKIAWSIPQWLMIVLIACFALIAAGFTSQMLMSAFLAKQAESHRRDADSILSRYPLEYRQMIESNAKKHNLSPAFVSAIILNESSFQPMVESSVGARGLMQLMPKTAEWIAQKMKVDGYAFERMYDPESNINFGCWYLNYLASLFHGDPVCVACAYHAGQGQVTAWLSDSRYSNNGIYLDLGRMSDGPTKTYAERVIRAYGIYQALYYNHLDVYDVLLPRPGQ